MATAPVGPAPAPAGPAPALQKPAWTRQPLPAQPPENLAGQLLAGRYMMGPRIGGGGMSTIHEAQDTALGIRVAVKIMRDDLPSDPVDRFRREAHILARLVHEHVARIIDRQDPEQGPRFLVTEYIDGINLSLLRCRGPLPAAVVHQIALQVSAALAIVHAAGVVHRDINPSNLMLVRHQSGDIFAKVIDFGIAQLERGSSIAAPENAPPGARRATRGDVVLGTAPYYRGHEGPQRDVYALALTLAELLTGEAPDPDADLSRATIPPALAQVITTALTSDKIATMDALHTALREADVQTAGAAETERRRYAAKALREEPSAPGKPPAADEAPKFAGRYIFCGDLGQGGMGRVQVAFDTQNRRRVALKTISPRCAGMKNLEYRFRREARALAAIEHSGAPTLYDSGSEPEHFFTMEIVEGVTLAATLKRGKIEPYRALSLAIDLVEILHAAHEVGVVHRDVKPDNIMISHGDRVRLLDFGACLLMSLFHRRHLLFPATPAEERYATGELEAVGTPGYSAPEVLGLEGGAGPRSDVYSVCAVLYEMLTRRPLVDRATLKVSTIERGEFSGSLASLADLLRLGTASEPSERDLSMADLARGLEVVRAGSRRVRERRQRALVALVAGVSTAIVALALQLAPALFPASLPVAHTEITAESATAGDLHADDDPPPLTGSPPVIIEATAEHSPAPPQPAAGPFDGSPPAAHSTPPGATPTGPDTKADPPRLAAVLTKASVVERVGTREAQIKAECAVAWISLDLTIHRGHASLRRVNGMTFSEKDPIHTCVRDQLHGLTFPRADKPASFSLTIKRSQPAHKDPG